MKIRVNQRFKVSFQRLHSLTGDEHPLLANTPTLTPSTLWFVYLTERWRGGVDKLAEASSKVNRRRGRNSGKKTALVQMLESIRPREDKDGRGGA